MVAVERGCACMNIALLVFAYLFGSVPFSLILGKLFKNIDIRKHGSGNLGTTNAFRVLGKVLDSPCFCWIR